MKTKNPYCMNWQLLGMFALILTTGCAAPQNESGQKNQDVSENSDEQPETPKNKPVKLAQVKGIQQNADPNPVAPKPPVACKGELDAFLAGQLSGETIKITYDDIHGLHGGFKLAIDGLGKIDQKTQYPGGTKAGKPKAAVSKEDVKKLVELLIEIEAWEQKVAKRPLLADEALVHLHIETPSGKVSIWEHYNDMPKHQRIGKVKALMSKIAWQ